MSKSQKEIAEYAMCAGVFGAVIYCMSGLGAGIAGAIILFLIFMLGHMLTAHDKHVADVQKHIYDHLLDQGTQMDFNGVLWTKDCRIDPDTGAVIKPGA